MNMFGFLSSGKKVVDDVFDKKEGLLAQAGGWIGGLSFTDQEQAEYRLKVGDKVADFVGASLSEKTERSQSRRSIAELWIKAQLVLILLTAIAIPWKMEVAKQYFNLATSDVMLWGTGSIICFFFGPYVWGTHIMRNQVKKEEKK